MTEHVVLADLKDCDVSRETSLKLQDLAQLVLAENRHQNLIAKSTEASIWDRHILDSAQLVRLAHDRQQCWLDVGAGAGFPGMVLAILLRREHVLVEPRRRRAEFLEQSAAALGLADNVRVLQSVVERVKRTGVGTITARAVTSVEKLLSATHHLAGESTTWLLHKGRNASDEIEHAKTIWDARFETIQSLTAADAAIVRVTGLTGRRP